MSIHTKHWTDKDIKALKKVKTFSQLADAALEIMKRHPHGVHMVSGPISTGGVGNREGNQKVFAGVIERIAENQDLSVFSQIPFEDKIVELKKAWAAQNPDADYCMPILTDFYEKIFSSGKVAKLHFIHSYESSQGAVWEHDNCVRWKIEKTYLSPEVSRDLYEMVMKKKK